MSANATSSTVTIEVVQGSGLSLGHAARRFPAYRAGRPVNTSTIFRWITGGVRLPDGRCVRLEAVRLGGRWLTSPQAIERFIAAQTPSLDTDPTPLPRTSAQRQRAADRAARQLDAAGI